MTHDVQPSMSGENSGALVQQELNPGYFRVIRVLDSFAEICGKIVSWLALPLVGGLVFEVIARYLFHAPTVWAYDLTYMLYGTIFMLGAAYTLLHKSHIRTDMLYRTFPVRVQGIIDTVCYLFLFFPGMLFFLNAGIDYAAHSWAIGEKTASAWGAPIYPFKTVIPISALFLIIQGISEFLKSYHAARRGEWL